MRSIGIDHDQALFYEGQGAYGRGVSPMPALLLATILQPPVFADAIPETEDLGFAQLIFREDSFDPITRLRRGRFYARASASQPCQWHVQSHPACPDELRRSMGGANWSPKMLFGISAWQVPASLIANRTGTLVALGPQSAYSLWRVVSIERIVTGESLMTLRARSSLGLVPELNFEVVPEDGRPKVAEVLDALAQAAHTSGPTSIVDRARDACQWCLGVWLSATSGDPKWRREDLGALARKLTDEARLSGPVAAAVARLHSRGKPNENERYGSRPLVEDDAEFALPQLVCCCAR